MHARCVGFALARHPPGPQTTQEVLYDVAQLFSPIVRACRV